MQRALICALCKHQQVTQIDSVDVLDKVQIAVAETVRQHAGNTGFFAERCAHPKDIMVTPLNINGRML